MTVTMRGSISQARPGAPLQVAVTEQATNNDNIDSTFVLAVTTTNVLPATLAAAAAFAGGTHAPFTDPFWDTYQEQDVFNGSGGVSTTTIATSLNVLQRLDSDFVVGRFAWAIGTADNPAAGSSVPAHHIGPYTIQ